MTKSAGENPPRSEGAGKEKSDPRGEGFSPFGRLQHLQNVFTETRAVVVGVDARNAITLWNPAAARLFGYILEEVAGRPFSSLLGPKGEGPPAPGGNIIEAVRKSPFYGPAEASFFTRTDGARRLELVAYPVHDAGGRLVGATIILRDGDEARRYWERVLRAEQLALVGQIASGLAHEIGTPLNVISGNAEYILSKLPALCPVDEASKGDPSFCPLSDEVKTIIGESDRIVRLIRKLLDFARPTPPLSERVEFGALLQEALSLVGPTFERAGIGVQVAVAEGLPPILGDRHQLEQVLMNLLVNAQHAMPGGGTVRVRVWPARLSGERRGLRVEVEDTGVGMSPEVLKRIFEPFFTTKGAATGTGLGLTVCQRIVSEHGGTIRAASAQGAGATFTLELPCPEAGGSEADGG